MKYLTNWYLILAAVISIQALTGIAFAQTAANNTVALNNAMAHLTCKVNFMVGFTSSITTNIPSYSSLSQYSTLLQSDISKLQSYASANDGTSFKSYITNNYDPDFATTRQAIVTSLANGVSNGTITSNTTSQLRSSYSSLQSILEGCNFAALRSMANNRIVQYNNIINNYQNQISKMTKNGINDTSSLIQILSNANTQIIQPLQAAINNANSSASLNMALRSYCLFSDCTNGTNYHLAAKFDYQRLTLIMANLQSKPRYSNYTSQFAQVQNYLNAAQSTLTSVGTSSFTGNQSQQVWSNLNSASQTIQSIIKSANIDAANKAKANNAINRIISGINRTGSR